MYIKGFHMWYRSAAHSDRTVVYVRVAGPGSIRYHSRMPDGEVTTRHALRARLRELIASSRIGDRLPSERALSLRWGVARMTVRHAMDALVAEGLVERRHGSGTYVVPQPLVRLLGLTSFSQDMRERGLVPSSRLLSFETVEADAPIGAACTCSRAIGSSPLAFASATASRWPSRPSGSRRPTCPASPRTT
jgi:DNA-binding transcriptional regulator YhcF (GntR family)